MKGVVKTRRPRKFGGGRSPRYDARREERGTTGACARSWSDAAAAAALQGLQDCSKSTHRKITCVVGEVLSDAAERERFVQGLALSPFDKNNTRAVLETHASRWDAGASAQQHKQRAKALLKPLYERRTACGEMEALMLTRVTAGGGTFAKWLSRDPTADRLRDIARGARTLEGLARWPLWCPRRRRSSPARRTSTASSGA